MSRLVPPWGDDCPACPEPPPCPDPPPCPPVAEWFAFRSAWLAGGVKGAGSRVNSVTTPYSLAGNRFTCVVDFMSGADGIPEGYTWAAPVGAMLADLGITYAQLVSGEKSILVATRCGPMDESVNVGLAMGASSDGTGDVNTLAGGGAGLQTRVGDIVRPMAFDSSQETYSVDGGDRAITAGVGRIDLLGTYWSATASAIVSGETKRSTANVSGFANPARDPYVIVWCGGNDGGEVDVDFAIWVAAVDGVAFDPVPPLI